MKKKAFQDYYPDDFNHCYGCGGLNEHGHQIKSYWDGEETIAEYTPKPYHTSLPGYVYGGLIASLIDCHSTGTAAAALYKKEDRAMDSKPEIRCVTASLHVDYLQPLPLKSKIKLRASIKQIEKTLPEGVVIEPFLDRTKLVNKAIGTVTKNLTEGALIVIFVLVLLLGNISALNSANPSTVPESGKLMDVLSSMMDQVSR